MLSPTHRKSNAAKLKVA